MSHSNTLQAFYTRSRSFYERHPRPISKGTTLEALVYSSRISEYNAKKYIQTNRILVHPKVRGIAKAFLEHMKQYGTKTEKAVYQELDWTVDRFIARLIQKRPLCFLTSSDTTLLRDGRKFDDATDNWDRVGTDHERQSVRMKDYLSYDEMMISSLLGVSGYTAYLNDGNRNNRGVLDLDNAQSEGIQVGLVGARFERPNRMDAHYISDSLTPHIFVSKLFSGHTFEQRYKARMRISIETLLLEAEARGGKVHRKTWVNVVGLGLGVWQIDKKQPQWYIEAFAAALNAMKIYYLDTLEFSWIQVDHHTQKAVESAAALSSTRVLWSKRPPSQKLADKKLLLVTTYAWDANSYPGNEFYLGMLTASGDPAAAASSLISETQNPEINTEMLSNIAWFE